MAENKTPLIKETERQPSIDLLRFIAAMMVATMHWGLKLEVRDTQEFMMSPPS